MPSWQVGSMEGVDKREGECGGKEAIIGDHFARPDRPRHRLLKPMRLGHHVPV